MQTSPLVPQDFRRQIVVANACLNGSKSRLLNRDNLFLFRSRYVRISRDPINKFDNVEIDTGGSGRKRSRLFSYFFISMLTESALLLRHTFQGFFICCFRRNRIFTLVFCFLRFPQSVLLAVRQKWIHVWKFHSQTLEKLIQGWSGTKTFIPPGFDSWTFSKSGLRLFLAHCHSNDKQKMCEHFDLQFFFCLVSSLHRLHVFRFISIFIAVEWDIIQHERKKYHLFFLPHSYFFPWL